ncbi:MAG: molybdopterin-dependent oxidoreductase [Magnetococcales bacterium]|nr:molybdopterin-dependent oxidoreductase [Magnetococcales bacterium]
MADRPWVRTTCPYCGTGCGIRVQADKQGRLLALEGDPDHPANSGRLCSKGMALPETLAVDQRLLNPEVAGKVVSWERALDHVAQALIRTVGQYGPDSVGFYLSGQLLTEDYYVANKLMKGFIGGANVDGNSRLCMSSAVVGHQRGFGADLVPGCYEDLDLAQLVVVAGSNTAWCHPVLFRRVTEARKRHPGRTLVVIDPRKTATAMEADLYLPIKGGSDIWLWLGLLHHLFITLREDKNFLRQHVLIDENSLELASSYAQNTTAVARLTGLTVRDVERFYGLFAATEQTVTLFSQGIKQSVSGSDTVSAILNCHLYTGRIGKPGMGPLSLTGQPNAMGGREVGAMPNLLAAHMMLDDPGHRKIVSRFWNSNRLATKPGLKAVELFQAVGDGRVKALWIMGTNPLVSLPDSQSVRRALARCPLVIVSDVVRHTDTTALAHVLLPARPWGEKSGSVTNSERCISRQRAFLPPVGQAKPDWWILAQVGQRMGFGAEFNYKRVGEIFREHATLSGIGNGGSRAFDIAALAGVDYDGMQPIQWPVRQEQGLPRGRARLGGDGRFFTPDRKARLVAVQPGKTTNILPDALRLNSGRLRDQWHTMTRTGLSPALSRHEPEPILELHPDDARCNGVEEGMLVRVVNTLGEAILRARVTTTQRQGELFAPMHWSRQFSGQAAINALVPASTDPASGQPASKGGYVMLLPVTQHWHGFLLTRQRVELTGSWWCRHAMEQGIWQYRLAGTFPLSNWKEETAAWIRGSGKEEWIDYSDVAQGRYRRAWRQEGRLMGCLFIEQQAPLPAAAQLLSFFTDQEWAAASLLSGRMAKIAAGGRTICACHGVSEGALRTAIRSGDTSVESLGKRLLAGTGCGSCIPEIQGMLIA